MKTGEIREPDAAACHFLLNYLKFCGKIGAGISPQL